MNVTVTPSAEKFMRRLVRFSESPNGGFRLKVSPGGCSGLSSEFTIEPAPAEGDSTLDVNGLKVFLPAESRILLEGVTIDFSDSVMATGLTFIDPKAGSCACSSSAPASLPGVVSVDISSIRRKTA